MIKIDIFQVCIDKIKSIDLYKVVNNSLTDFDGMHDEISKRKLL